MRHLLRVSDLDLPEIDGLLGRAEELAAGAAPRAARSGATVGLLFLSASLRTRVGYGVAAHRVGAQAIEVDEPRWTPAMSEGESFADTVRTLSGMVDLLVCRTPFPLVRAEIDAWSVAPVVNGGDGGGEHPTQALIDLAAIRRCGPVGSLRIAIAGDLSSRTVASLVRALELDPPAELRLAGPSVDGEVVPGPALASRSVRCADLDVAGIDVLYLAGLPAQLGRAHLDHADRRRWALTPERAAVLPPQAAVLSPLPIVDEIDADVRNDPRVLAFAQSDHGVHVRTAVLERMLGAG